MDEFQKEILIKRARLKFFTNELIFFGMMANKFIWEIEPLPENIEGYVEFNLKDPSKLESGVIHINELYVSKEDYTYNNLVFIICHELLHILNKHGLRRNDREFRIWNIACDHLIEVFLRKLDHIIKPYNNQYNIIEELYNHKREVTAEFAYDWIMKNQSKFNIKSTGEKSISVSYDNQKNEYTVILNLGGVQSEIIEDESTVSILTDQMVSEARAIFENLKNKGNSSGALVEYLNKILKVEIPWETLLEKAIKTNVVMKPDDRSWSSLNKYFIPHNITLPGYYMIEDKDGVGTLIIGTDTSGSISTKNLKKFSYVIEKSMRYFKTIKLITHDVEIHQEKEFNRDNISEFYKFIAKEGYKGRGGTSHKHLFDKIKKLWDEDKDDLSMVISLTDSASDIESIYKSYEFIKNNLPLVFIVPPDGRIMNLDNTFGTITQIKMN